MKLGVDLAASVPEVIERSEHSEDLSAWDKSLTCFALSDGASESDNPRARSATHVGKKSGHVPRPVA